MAESKQRSLKPLYNIITNVFDKKLVNINNIILSKLNSKILHFCIPQIAPIRWIFLFTIFSMLFIFSAVKTYYSKNEKSEKNDISTKIKINSINWKW